MCRLSTVEERISETENTPREIRNQKHKDTKRQTEQNYQELWDNIKHSNICNWHLIRKREIERDQRNIWGKKLRSFPNLVIINQKYKQDE